MTPFPGLDPLKSAIAHDLADAIAAEFGPVADLEATLLSTIERPKNDSHGDYAVPLFRLAKSLQKAPPALASSLAAGLPSRHLPWLAKAEAVGAFLNLHLQQPWVAAALLPEINSGAYFKALANDTGPKDRVMVEYSQPNTHKLFHVGHMRNVALGDSLWRLFEYLGHPVIPVNYIGDEGSHIAKCVWHIQRTGANAPSSGKAEWLGQMYADACMSLEDASGDEKKRFEAEVSQVLAAIEAKSGPLYEFWQESRQWSLDSFNEVYAWLGARFDRVFYESEVSAESQSIVDEYLAKGVFVADDGAIGTDLKEFKLGFMLARKRDGNTLYATKDLVLARRKFEEFGVDRSVYVVGAEQIMHFKQVFKTLELMGFPQAKACFHLWYGLVVLPEGKMSSRSGTVIPFSTLRQSLESELDSYLTKYRGVWSDEEIARTRHQLCVGAIRYGMLCSDPMKDIVFNLKDWLSFEGDTGPYLMYALARTRSILRKASEAGYHPENAHWETLTTPEEHELLRHLADFNGVVKVAADSMKPSVLTHHLFVLAKAFNRFHHEVSVLKADSAAARGARLSLVQAFASCLAKGLNLLGIDPPERM